MLIDWFTVAAQAVNFLVLVWLLKRFLYRPVLNAMSEREKHIAENLKNAERQTALAEQQREEWRRKTVDLDRQRAALLQEAVTQADAQRDGLLREGREEAETARSKWRESLRSEQAALQRELAVRVQQEVFAIARKTLGDLATSSLEESMAEHFAKRLRELNGPDKQRLVAAVNTTRNGAILRSAFTLSAAAQAHIRRAVVDTLTTEMGIRYETAPDLIGGIELEVGGERVSWNISNYLMSLEQSVRELTSIARQETNDAGTP